MAHQRHLNHAPIREALIDVQVAEVSLAAVDRVVGLVRNRFQKSAVLWQASLGLNFGVDGQNSTSAQQIRLGTRLETDDGCHVLQLRTNGFTFSRLIPYMDWQQLRDEAADYWKYYADEARPAEVVRLAVRYINELHLPLPMVNLDDYLVASPKIPEGLPQALSSFIQRVIIAERTSSSTAIVTQAFEGSAAAPDSHVPIFLDIDVFRSVNISTTNLADIWPILAELRDFKNAIFFSHLTEKAVELFE